MRLEELKDFYEGKRVLITGHTGFKGSWLCRILTLAGAQVTGYALDPPTDPSVYHIAGIGETIKDIRGISGIWRRFAGPLMRYVRRS